MDWQHGPVPSPTPRSDPVPPLVLITGDETLLVDRAITSVLVRVRKAQPEVERRDAAAAGLSVGELIDLISPSLFAEPRLVLIRGAHEAGKDIATALTDYLKDPVEGVTLVLQHSGGARNKALSDAYRKAGAVVLTCEKVTKPAERLEFVRAEIRAAGGTTTPDAVAALVDAVGNDLAELSASATQLVSDTGGQVDENSVRRYHRGRAEVSGFTVSDLAVAGDIPGALEAVRWALSVGVAHVLVADALADGIRTVAKVAGARGGNSYALASELGMPPWKIDRARNAARGWSEPALAAAMTITADVNAAVKGQAADPDYALEKAVIDLGRARRLR